MRTKVQNVARWMNHFYFISEGMEGHEKPVSTATLAELIASAHEWEPIATAPKDGTFILLAGPSGYSTTPLRVEVGRWYPEYRPGSPWQTHSNDDFTDGGPEPTHWMPLPKVPGGIT